MKRTVFSALFLFVFAYNARSQSGSNEYTNANLNWVSGLSDEMYKQYKDQFTLRRVETGTLKLINGRLSAYTERKLFDGLTYFVSVSSDDRVKDIKLKYYKQSNNNWEILKIEDDGGEKLKKVPFLGDRESAMISPTEAAIYKFEIEAPNQSGSGRYTIMVWSKDPTVTAAKSATKITYSVDTYSISEFDKSTKKYADFGKDTPFVCSFEINAEESRIRQIGVSGSITVYDIQQKTTDSDSWTKYSIRSPDGIRYGFWLPKDATNYIRVFKIDGNANNALTDYHIKSKVAE